MLTLAGRVRRGTCTGLLTTSAVCLAPYGRSYGVTCRVLPVYLVSCHALSALDNAHQCTSPATTGLSSNASECRLPAMLSVVRSKPLEYVSGVYHHDWQYNAVQTILAMSHGIVAVDCQLTMHTDIHTGCRAIVGADG